MIKVKIKRIGFSLAEIIMALGIFALLAVPAYVMFSYSAAEDKAYHKTAAANKIMQSFRDEIKNLSYDLAKNYGNDLKNQALTLNSYHDFPPKTGEVIQSEKAKFDPDGATITIEASETNNGDISTLQYKITVKWKQRGSDRSEYLSFIKVK